MIGPAEIARRTGVAIQFLTRIPVPGLPYADGDLQRSLGAFPAVGLLVAGVGIAVRASLDAFVGTSLATVGAIAAMIAITGGLHEDGLADTFDGLWGGTTPEERLAIMRDSRIGTYGALALILAVLAQFAILAPVSAAAFASAVVAGAVLGRASSLPLLRWMPPAPASSAALAGRPSAAALAVAGVIVALALGVAVGWAAWVPLAIAVAISSGCALVISRKVGGINGDTLGATNVLVSLSAIAACVALRT